MNRPSRSHWQLHTHMQWAHPNTSVAFPETITGPDIAIGSYSWAFQWAHPIALAEPHKKSIGLAIAISSCNRIYDGPTLLHRLHFQNK